MVTLLFAAAQLLDLVSYSPTSEANPVPLLLGALVPIAKLAATGLVILAAVALARREMPVRGRLLLELGAAVACLGAASNLP